MDLASPKRTDAIVFLLGAGASASYGLPVMAGFLDQARRRAFDVYENHSQFATERNWYQSLLKFHSRCLTSSWAFNRNWDNLEEIYTQADLCRIAGIDHRDQESHKLCEDIAWAIWDVYRRDQELPDHSIAFPLLKVMEEGLQPVIVTTNYDLVAERAIWESRKMPHASIQLSFKYPGFSSPTAPLFGKLTDWDETQAYAYDLSKAKNHVETPLIKLHGSVNWFSSKDHHSVYYDLGPALASGKRIALNEDLPFDRLESLVNAKKLLEEQDRFVGKLKPTIVPPTLGKSSDIPLITCQWLHAIEYLSRARQIWIIGYSFPETDTFMTRLLTQGVQHNRDLEFIKVVNTESASRFRPRLEAIFNATFLANRVEYLQMDAVQFNRGYAEGRLS